MRTDRGCWKCGCSLYDCRCSNTERELPAQKGTEMVDDLFPRVVWQEGSTRVVQKGKDPGCSLDELVNGKNEELYVVEVADCVDAMGQQKWEDADLDVTLVLAAALGRLASGRLR